MIAVTVFTNYLTGMRDVPAPTLRLAEPSDSALLAKGALAAGGGLYEHLLARATRGFAAETALAAAIASADEGLSWRNAIVAEGPNGPCGGAIAYGGDAFCLAPAIAAASDPAARDDLAGLFRTTPPADSFYLHAIWTDPASRGRGVGGLLLDAVMAWGQDLGFARTSLHVWRDNTPALALYRSRSFRPLAEIPVARRPLLPHDGGKLLMATDG